MARHDTPIEGFSYEDLKEALLFAVANGWRPANVLDSAHTFPPDEAETMPACPKAVER